MKVTTISQAGIDCLIAFEGLRQKAYLDTGGVWTIGVGTTRYPDGRRVKGGDTCTREQAMDWLRHDCGWACATVDKLCRDDLNQHQFDALVSLVYNIGPGQFAGSTVRRLVNANPQDKAIGKAFALWNKDNGRVVAGLANRRAREAALYFS